MDFNARFYSQRLGRFISADSLIPNPGSAMDFDRYMYSAGNPLRFIDPSEHGYCDSEYALWEECEGWYGVQNDVPLTHAGDPIPGYPGKTSRIGGDKVYDLYTQYRDTPGWWNNDTVGIFTLEDFVGMYILFESNIGDIDSTLAAASTLSTIFAQNLYVGGANPAVCQVGGTCYNAVFNFIAANIDGSSALLSGPNNKANQLFALYNPGLGTTPDKIRERISSLGVTALDPNSVVDDRYFGPSKWGNINGADELWRKLPKDANGNPLFGKDVKTVYYMFDNAVYLSVKQYNHWKSLDIDMSLNTRGD